MIRANLDIPTTFNRPKNLDSGLSKDLSRLAIAVDTLSSDPFIQLVPSSAPANGNATLSPRIVTRLNPPASGTVVVILPLLTGELDNVTADLVITGTSAALISVLAGKGTTVNGQASLTFIAAPYWYRFIWSGGNWYRG